MKIARTFPESQHDRFCPKIRELFTILVSKMPCRPNKHNPDKIWTNGESIMCHSEETAYAVADILDAFGGECTVGYYDPEEDERNAEVDECTGYWYVCV